MGDTVEKLKRTKQAVINPRQLMVFVLMNIIGVVTGMLPLFLGEKFDAYFFVGMIVLDYFAYAAIMTMRSVKPETVPDSSMGLIGKVFSNFVISIIKIISKRDGNKDYDNLMGRLESLMHWTMTEWDVLYQEQLSDGIEYYKKKLKKQHKAEADELIEKREKLQQELSKIN